MARLARIVIPGVAHHLAAGQRAAALLGNKYSVPGIRRMAKYSKHFRAALLVLITGCSNAHACDIGFERYSAYLYRTPEQSFLFFKNGDKKPLGFIAEEDRIFLDSIDRVFSSHYGRSIGVEAEVCGKIEPVAIALSPYTESVTIRSGAIVRNVDLTEIIQEYQKALGYPKLR
jgi:hypothetical protein